MRGGIGRQLRSRATTLRKVEVDDGEGGWEEDWATLGLNRQCRRRAATASDITIAEQVQGNVEHLVYWLPGEDIAYGDQVIVDGYELKVLGVLEPSEPRYLLTPCQQIQIGATTP